MSVKTAIERTVDWGLGMFSPERRAISKHFEQMRGDGEYRDTFLALMRARGYRAASSTGGAPFSGSNKSADAEILTDLPALTARCRELTRDDPIASGLKQTFVNNVVGPGMVPQARTGDEGKDEQLETYWKRRKNRLFPADDMTHAEHQRMLFGEFWECGSIFLKASKLRPDEPIFFEVIEKDRVSTPIGKITNPLIVDGVEKDEIGRVIAYHVARSRGAIMTREWTPVPAAQMLHWKISDRPGQTHGVPAMHAVIQDLRDLDLLILAALKRVQIAACLSVFIKTAKNIEQMFSSTAKEYGYEIDQTIRPGMIFRLFPDEEIQTVIPNFPTSEFDPFIVLLARRIGSALGVSWQIVMKDFSQSTYSSARTDLLESRQIYTLYQSSMIEKPLNWEWSEVMFDGLLLGELPGIVEDDIDKIDWIPPGWQWIDPESEAASSEIELRLGITTLQRICASRGLDWKETLTQRLTEAKYEADLRDKLGLVAEEKSQPPGGWWTINEKRAKDGLAPMTGGDAIYLPASEIPAIEDETEAEPGGKAPKKLEGAAK